MFVVALVTAACAAAPPPEPQAKLVKIEDHRAGSFAVDVAELEIRAVGVDRFVRCPPAAELGRAWYPEPFPIDWLPPDPSKPARPPAEIEPSYYPSSASDRRSPQERAVEDTHRAFRQCYRKGTVRGSMEGHVAIVVRVGKDGRPIRVEEYAACALPAETIQCMKDMAARLRFDAPANGSGAITIPANFESRDGARGSSGPNAAYTVGAYVTIESARPLLHACDREIRVNLRPVEANASITLRVVSDGRVENANVDAWSGNKDMVACAAKALTTLRFDPPPGGVASISTKLSINPSQ